MIARLAFIAAIVAGLGRAVLAQSIPFPGPGMPATSVSYSGPGDVVSGALIWYGLRCYNAAYSGNVADVWDGSTGSTTETLLGCDGAGNIVVKSGSAIATTCAVSCRVKTLYDQSGTLDCTGSVACDVTQATNSKRPTYTLNCLNTSLPCMTFDGANSQLAASVSNASHLAPNSVSFTAKRTGTPAAGAVIGHVYNNYFSATADTVRNNTNSVTASATDNAWHAVNYYAPSANNGVFNVDGTVGASSTETSSTTATTANVGNNNTGTLMTGSIAEVGVWNLGFTATQANNLCHNQFAYWATSTSC